MYGDKSERRPTVSVLRGMLLNALVEIGGHCKVVDERSEEWLEKLSAISQWSEEEFDDFVRFFAQLDLHERVEGHENEWIYSLSTPFLTRLPTTALVKIAQRTDGGANAIVDKYCQWARTTNFLFHFADTVCNRLVAIFDNGDTATKALAMIALIALGESHNRWYVMRCMLRRCAADEISNNVSRRLAIEIQTEEVERQFCRCIDEAGWDIAQLTSDLAKLHS